MTDKVVIYTDGACSGNPGPGGWGYIALDEDTGKWLERDCGGEKDTTNNRMEMLAVINALISFRLGMPNELTIVSDSKYVIQGITEWLPNWKKRNWIGSNKKPVKNRDLWIRLDAAAAQISNLKWQWVKGHSGNHWNEEVDQLAVSAIPKD